MTLPVTRCCPLRSASSAATRGRLPCVLLGGWGARLTVHHELVGHALHNRALGLLEAALGPTARGVGEEHRRVGLGGDVVREGNVVDLDILERELVEELNLGGRHIYAEGSAAD